MVDISSRSSSGHPPEMRISVLSPRTRPSAVRICRSAATLEREVICASRHAVSACIWIPRMHESEPNPPKAFEERGPGAGAPAPAPLPPDPPVGAGPELPESPPEPPEDGVGAGDGDDVLAPPPPPPGVIPPPPPAKIELRHSRSPTDRTAIMLRFAMSRASLKLPYSHVALLGPARPVTCCNPSRTRSWAQVKGTFGPTGSSINADRSAYVRRVKNRDAAVAT